MLFLALFTWQVQANNDLLYTERGKDYSFGNLENFNRFSALGTGNLTFGSINSEDGIVDIQWRYKESYYNQLSEENKALIDNNQTKLIRDAYRHNYEDILDLPHFTINGDVNVATLRAAAVGTINGNVTVNGTLTREQIYSGNYDHLYSTGMLRLGGSYDLGGITVNGDIKSSALFIAHHQPHKIDLDQWRATPVGGLVVNGDVTVDWLFVDIGQPDIREYDNWGEFIKVTGTAHVKEDLFMGGAMEINKLIVDGTFFNGFGQYIEYPTLPSTPGEGIEGLNPPDFVSSTINELDAKNIENASNLFVGTLTNDRNQTYNQTYGTIRVTNNWFENSVINMSGGYIDEASLGPDKNLGIGNIYYITGGTLIVGDLNFESEVNLSDKGKIQTDIESIFINPQGDPEALNYIGLNATKTESVKASLTKWFTNYVAGTLRTDLEDHVNFNGGSIVVSGFGKITETQYHDLLEAFKEAFLNSIRKDLLQA